jgi:hypothetical protein
MNTIDFVQTDCSDLACHTGVTFLVDCLLYQACNGLPDDLTGYTASLLVFDEIETNVIIDIPGTIDPLARGVIHFQVSAAVTDTLPIGMYSNHVQVTSSGGIVYRLSSGAFQITQ